MCVYVCVCACVVVVVVVVVVVCVCVCVCVSSSAHPAQSMYMYGLYTESVLHLVGVFQNEVFAGFLISGETPEYIDYCLQYSPRVVEVESRHLGQFSRFDLLHSQYLMVGGVTRMLPGDIAGGERERETGGRGEERRDGEREGGDI